jgi:3-deoxy-D-manno-octulosonic-acid transferase
MWWLYQALSAFVHALAGPLLVLVRGRHYLPTIRGRLALRLPAGPRGAIWIHAVSVGEVSVAETLVRALPEGQPVVVSTITPTGQERARRAFAGRAGVAFAPFELGFSIRRFFDGLAPRALILIEGDYWPLLLREAERRDLPVAVVNGRISDRSFPRLRLLRRIVRPLLLDRVGRFAMQTALDRDRLIALGVAEERVQVTGNLKFEAPAPESRPELEEWLSGVAAGRPILVAGSTMPGEERKVLDAFSIVCRMTSALLVIAPRHPERFAAVAEEIARRFPGSVRRTASEPPAEPPPVALLDTLGELAAAYESAAVAFVGGTLVRRGGHNPLEAARFGVPVVVGPSMENFRQVADVFDRAAAWARADNAQQLAEVWQRWLLDPNAGAELGRRGQDLIESHRGALDRTLELLQPIVDGSERRA